jgi:hypothetical protein
MTALGDFRFITLVPTGARQIAGFGSARTVGAEELAQVLAMDTGSDAGSADGGPAAAAQPAA